MVNGTHIDIHTITLEELAGVLNLYPWYGAARVELCRRMCAMGGEDWGEEQFASEALYVPDRSKLSSLLRGGRREDYTDKDVADLLSSFMEPAAVPVDAADEHAVQVKGGDYFSQAQYDNVKQGSDNIFSRFAGKPGILETDPDSSATDIADRFATETLARIFVEQGRIEEAKRIYSRLVLDIPEKSAYFASLIDELNKIV